MNLLGYLEERLSRSSVRPYCERACCVAVSFTSITLYPIFTRLIIPLMIERNLDLVRFSLL